MLVRSSFSSRNGSPGPYVAHDIGEVLARGTLTAGTLGTATAPACPRLTAKYGVTRAGVSSANQTPETGGQWTAGGQFDALTVDALTAAAGTAKRTAPAAATTRSPLTMPRTTAFFLIVQFSFTDKAGPGLLRHTGKHACLAAPNARE